MYRFYYLLYIIVRISVLCKFILPFFYGMILNIMILKRGGMPLHDAVGINCNKGAITEHQDSAVKYMG